MKTPPSSEPAAEAVDDAGPDESEEPTERDWGLSTAKPGMARETKLGLTFIVVVLVGFSYVIYQRLQNAAPAVAATDAETAPEASGTDAANLGGESTEPPGATVPAVATKTIPTLNSADELILADGTDADLADGQSDPSAASLEMVNDAAGDDPFGAQQEPGGEPALEVAETGPARARPLPDFDSPELDAVNEFDPASEPEPASEFDPATDFSDAELSGTAAPAVTGKKPRAMAAEPGSIDFESLESTEAPAAPAAPAIPAKPAGTPASLPELESTEPKTAENPPLLIPAAPPANGTSGSTGTPAVELELEEPQTLPTLTAPPVTSRTEPVPAKPVADSSPNPFDGFDVAGTAEPTKPAIPAIPAAPVASVPAEQPTPLELALPAAPVQPVQPAQPASPPETVDERFEGYVAEDLTSHRAVSKTVVRRGVSTIGTRPQDPAYAVEPRTPRGIETTAADDPVEDLFATSPPTQPQTPAAPVPVVPTPAAPMPAVPTTAAGFPRSAPYASTPAAAVPSSALPAGETYTVAPTDTFWAISRKHYGTARYFMALTRHNQDRVPNPLALRPGTQIATPAREVLEQRYPELIEQPLAVATAPTPPADTAGRLPPAMAIPAAPVADDPDSRFFVGSNGEPLYRVGADDTLTSISQRHLGRSSRWTEIYDRNRDLLPSPDQLKIGTVIRLPTDASRLSIVPGPTERR